GLHAAVDAETPEKGLKVLRRRAEALAHIEQRHAGYDSDHERHHTETERDSPDARSQFPGGHFDGARLHLDPQAGIGDGCSTARHRNKDPLASGGLIPVLRLESGPPRTV